MGCIGSKNAGGFPKIVRKPFKDTNISEIDEYFSTLAAPLDTICDISEALSTADESINTLKELDEFKESLGGAGELKDILKQVFSDLKKDGWTLAVKLADDFTSFAIDINNSNGGEPKGFIAKAIDALKSLIEAIQTLFEKIPEILTTIKEAIEKTKEWGLDKLKEMAANAGLSGLAVMKAAQAAAGNVKQLGGVPGDVAGLMSAVKDLTTTLKDCA
mmetsp:Transcript_23530/g.33206  ORF Transcript_23530/g.33206 Transcript_23530/m.33206 type:complete len:217 (-) Transcript_23530:367-1017(-)|eukprot:CAMPEP_0175104184 /NCGR_PEP_ID=MMETSP0086_2-20121207/9559_1 /TAXON_ID=136419 /ORGANISM="Unknown Unknown, Strain D1" /LENGTH=216 /DNA_ID=CAMNT_0016379493 /DNA_START=27 /DNA_END=677 /DNA_ORIENTATION=-